MTKTRNQSSSGGNILENLNSQPGRRRKDQSFQSPVFEIVENFLKEDITAVLFRSSIDANHIEDAHETHTPYILLYLNPYLTCEDEGDEMSE